jgi:hypothetical protein
VQGNNAGTNPTIDADSDMSTSCGVYELSRAEAFRSELLAELTDNRVEVFVHPTLPGWRIRRDVYPGSYLPQRGVLVHLALKQLLKQAQTRTRTVLDVKCNL